MSFDEPGGVRPDRLFEVRPQEKVPAAHRGPSWWPCLHTYDLSIPKQVIEVPKISFPSRVSRTVLSEPQTAEQLLKAPTTASLVDVMEQLVGQTVDIPVGAGGLGSKGLQGSRPGQSSTAFFRAGR